MLKASNTNIKDNILHIQQCIVGAAERVGRDPCEVTLVAVSKTVSPALIQEAFDAGMRAFGENKVQEAQNKIQALANAPLIPSPTWHLVGHLQTNKAKIAAELFNMIQSVDSVKLAETLSQHAQKNLPILLQVNISEEPSKSGFSTKEISSAIGHIGNLPKLQIRGLMTIAPPTDNFEECRPFFKKLRLLRDSLGLEHLSMGMTNDFEIAIEEGATLLRIGRAIFGERKEPYHAY